MNKTRDYLKYINLDIVADRSTGVEPKAITLPCGTKAILSLRVESSHDVMQNPHYHYLKVYTPFNARKIELEQINVSLREIKAHLGVQTNPLLLDKQLLAIQIMLDAPSNIDSREIDIWRNYVADCCKGKFEDATGYYWSDCANDIIARRDRYIETVKAQYTGDLNNVISSHIDNEPGAIFGDIDD